MPVPISSSGPATSTPPSLELLRDQASGSVSRSLSDETRLPPECHEPGRDVRRLAARSDSRAPIRIRIFRDRTLQADDDIEE